MVFEDNVPASQIFFVIEGKVAIYSKVHDSGIQKHVKMSKNTGFIFNKMKTDITLSPIKVCRPSIKKRLNPSKKVNMKLCELKEGSILCGNLAIVKSKLNVHCYTHKLTKMFVLKSSVIEDAAKENLRLRMSINRTCLLYTSDAADE